MQREKNKVATCISWALVILCMVVIFYFSSRTATQSAQQSGSILDFFTKIFGENIFTDFIIRKSAHCLEYTGLALLTSTALYFTFGKIQHVYAVSIASIYAISDEVHQIFVDGRSCELRDWAIDTIGAIIGAILFAIIFNIIKLILNKNKNVIDSNSQEL